MEKENKLSNGMKHLLIMIGIAVLLMFAGILKVNAEESDFVYLESKVVHGIKTTGAVADSLSYEYFFDDSYDIAKSCFVLKDYKTTSIPQMPNYVFCVYSDNTKMLSKYDSVLTDTYVHTNYNSDGSVYSTNTKNNYTAKIQLHGINYYEYESASSYTETWTYRTNVPVFNSDDEALAYFVNGDESGNINKPEVNEKYDDTLPNIQNLVYKSISPKECHGKNTSDCVTCFNLSWKVPVDKTESDIYQVKMYAKYSYTTTDSNSLQYKTEMIDISNCSGTFLVGEGTQDICAQDIKENLNINNLSTFDIHTIYKIYVRTMRTTSDHVSRYGNWTEFTMNKGILNNTSVGESVEVPGDADINDDGTINRELKGVIYLNDFYLKNVSVGKMDIFGKRNISWTSTTRDADVLLVPDRDTLVVATYIVENNDAENTTTPYEYKTVTIGANGFQFEVSDIFDMTDNSDCKWDGKLRLCPIYYSNGYMYVGELTVIDVLNDKVINEGVDDEGNFKQEDVTPDATVDNNTMVNYTNTFLSYLQTLIGQIGELPSLFAVVFAFIPAIYLNVIGVIFIIILILRVLGR